MIDALIAGKVYGTPAKRTAANGHTFVVGKIRVPMRDGETVFVAVITFSRSCGEVLLALDEGDSVALSGELKITTYQAKDGTVKPSLDLMAHAALTSYHVQRKRQAVRGEGHEPAPANGHQAVTATAPACSSAATAPATTAPEEGFNDPIPF